MDSPDKVSDILDRRDTGGGQLLARDGR